jgi:Tfp pilus assembly protein PilX
MTRPSNSPRGFAMIMALAMLGLAAIMLIVLAQYFAYQQTRTRTVTADAQLSQLLLAAAYDTLAHSRSWPAAPAAQTWKLDLPKTLSTQNARVAINAQPSAPDAVTVNIDASFDNQQAAQTLHLRHSASGWQIASAQLAGAN